MSEKDKALELLYKKLREAIEAKKVETNGGEWISGYNTAIEDVLYTIDQSSDEMWYDDNIKSLSIKAVEMGT